METRLYHAELCIFNGSLSFQDTLSHLIMNMVFKYRNVVSSFSCILRMGNLKKAICLLLFHR